MKNLVWLSLLFFIAVSGCKKSDSEEGSIAELKNHNMAIVPEQPTSKDPINFIIYNDCEYNKLVENKRTGKTITIEKQFNSSMKLACVEKNDTISIGKLPAGNYILNYQLTDLAANVSNPVALSVSVTLTVSK